MRKAPYQGGFSNEIYNTPEFQGYIKHAAENKARHGSSLIFGYIGSRNRTPARDRAVEQLLQLRHKNGPNRLNRMASWLTSSDGRHMMERVGYNMKIAEFQQLVCHWIGYYPQLHTTHGKNGVPELPAVR